MRFSLSRLARGLLFATVLAAAAVASAGAAEIKVLTTGAFKPVVSELAADFETRTGHTVVVLNDTAGAVSKRVAAGEAFDVLVLTPGPLQALAQSGTVGPPVRLAQVAIGVAVKQGAPAPDVSSVAAFQAALLAARAIATIDPAAGGSSGIYLWQLFDKMGIAAQLKPKAVLVPGGLVAQRLLTGESDLAIHQISEILAVPGVTLVGPLPAQIQNYTVYAGAVSTSAREAAAAQAFLNTLTGPAAAWVLKVKGMEVAP